MALESRGKELARLYNLFNRAYEQRNEEETKKALSAIYNLIFEDYLTNCNTLRQAKEELKLVRDFRKRYDLLETIFNYEKTLCIFIQTLNDLVEAEFGKIYG